MAWMLPRTGSPSLHFLCASETSSMPIGFKLVMKNHPCALRIREASCCETTTVLTVTAVPGFTRTAQAPALKAHSSSLSIIENVQYNTEPIDQQTKPSMEVTMRRKHYCKVRWLELKLQQQKLWL